MAVVRNIEVRISANTASYVAALKQAEAATRKFHSAASATGGGAATATRNTKAMSSALNDAARGGNAALNSFQRLGAAVTSGNKAFAAAKGGIGGVGKSLAVLESVAISAVTALVGFAAIHVAITTARKAVTFTTDAIMGFNKAMTESTAIMGDLDEQTQRSLENAALYTSSISTFNPTQAAEGLYYLASAGYSADQAIRLLPQAARFAQAGLMDLDKATEYAVDVQKAVSGVGKAKLYDPANIQTTVAGFKRVTDVITKTAIISNATIEQVAQGLTGKLGPQLRLLNKDIEEGAAILAVYANQGVKGSVASTQAAMALRDLQTRAIKNADVFKQFGLTVFNSNGKMLHTADIIQQLETILGGMSDETKRATLLQMGFQDRSVQAILSLVGFSKQLRQVDDDLSKAGGSTQEVAEKQLASFSSQMSLASNAAARFAVEIGRNVVVGVSKLVSILTPAFNAVRDALESLWKAAQPVIEVFGKLFGAGIIAGVTAFAKVIEVAAGAVESLSSVLVIAGSYFVAKWLVGSVLIKGLGGFAKASFASLSASAMQASTVTSGAFARMGAALQGFKAQMTGAAFYSRAMSAELQASAMRGRMAFMQLSNIGNFMRNPFGNLMLGADGLRTKLLTTASASKIFSTQFVFGMATSVEASQALTATMSALGFALKGAFTGALVLIPMILGSFQKADQEAKEFASTLTQEFDQTNYSDLMEQQDLLKNQWDSMSSKVNEMDTSWLSMTTQMANPFDTNTIIEAEKDATAVGEAYLATTEKVKNFQDNADILAKNFKLPGESIETFRVRLGEMAAKAGVDLTKTAKSSSDARDSMASNMQAMTKDLLNAGYGIEDFSTMSAEEITNTASIIDEQTKNITKNIVAMFDPTEAASKASEMTKAIYQAFETPTDVFGNIKSDMESAAKEAAQAQADAYNEGIDKQKEALDKGYDDQKDLVTDKQDQMSDVAKKAEKKRLDDQKESLDAQKKQLDDSKKEASDFETTPNVSVNQWIESLRSQGDAVVKFREQMQGLRTMGASDDLMMALSEMGSDAVPLLNQLATMLPDEAKKLVDNLNNEFKRFNDIPETTFSEFRIQLKKQGDSARAFMSNILTLQTLGIDPAQLKTLAESPELAGVVQDMVNQIQLAPNEQAKQQAIADIQSTTADVYAAKNVETGGLVEAMELAMSASLIVAEEGANNVIAKLAGMYGKTPEQVKEMLTMLNTTGGVATPGFDPNTPQTGAPGEAEKKVGKAVPDVKKSTPKLTQKQKDNLPFVADNPSKKKNRAKYFPKDNMGRQLQLGEFYMSSDNKLHQVGFYAGGGIEKHSAMIGKGTTRVWNEPETGGEAYIPMAASKRAKSAPILAQVAKEFGYGLMKYANGGFYGTAGSTMVGGGRYGTHGNQAAQTIVVPVQSTNQTNFNGPIQGVNMDEALAFAERKKRERNLTR